MAVDLPTLMHVASSRAGASHKHLLMFKSRGDGFYLVAPSPSAPLLPIFGSREHGVSLDRIDAYLTATTPYFDESAA